MEQAGKEKHYFDEESLRAMNKSLLISGFLLVATIAAAFLVEEWALLLGAMTLFVFILSFVIPRRMREAELEAQQWKGVKRYLHKYHFREADRGELLKDIDRYLVYGVVLAVTPKVTKVLAECIPADQYAAIVPWYAYSAMRGDTMSPAAFGEAISSVVASVSTTMSSAAGAGGGASSGGGGGAGGSGGSAG